ncbi:hypothetical protein BY458DRAFT_517508 [Sporodiniella umbellata]|nr:hypothetical protein BY458DRAFT_517508 [Sporodiniella umbellata]
MTPVPFIFNETTKQGRRRTNSIQCSNCNTANTPLWRRSTQGYPLCNACGLFYKLHGTMRPLRLKTDVIKRRKRLTNNKLPTTYPQLEYNCERYFYP